MPVDFCSTPSLEAFSMPASEAVRWLGAVVEFIGLDARAFRIVWRGMESAERKLLRWSKKDEVGTRERNGELGSDATSSGRGGSDLVAVCGALALHWVTRSQEFISSPACAGSC
jgi:hypothetical protein